MDDSHELRLDAAAKLSAPGMGLIITGVLVIVTAVTVGLLNVVGALAVATDQTEDSWGAVLGGTIGLILVVPFVLLGFLVLWGGVLMRQVRSLPLCITAGVLAVLPCNPCCFVGIPIGVWALASLTDDTVKAAFGVGPPPTDP
jgi:hypothetical protein